MLCMSGSVRRTFTADNGRAIFRWIISDQPVGDHLTRRPRLKTLDIDSNTPNEDGLNGTSRVRTLAAEEKIY
jgi:hypothetical protein